MWTWKVTLKDRSTGEGKTVIGLEYPDPDSARWMLADWLRKMLPGLYLYQLVDANVVLVAKEDDKAQA